MAILDFLAYSVAYLLALAVGALALLASAFLVMEHRALRRKPGDTPAPQPVPPQPDPDIAWVLKDDDDPAEVARLQAKLARPLSELIAEGERRAIAMRYPLDGDPRVAGVTDCTVSDPRQFPPPEDMIVLLPGGGVRYVAQPPPRAAEITGVGERQRSFVLPAGATYTPLQDADDPVARIYTTARDGVVARNFYGGTHYSGHCLPAGGGGGPVAEPRVLGRLRERRFAVGQAAMAMAEQASMTGRPCFTDEEQEQWGSYMNELEFLDKRIGYMLDLLARRL